MRIAVVGFGWAGYEAAITCKRIRPDAEITVISKESIPAYCRCGLTNAIAREVEFESLFLRPLSYYEEHRIKLLLGYEAVDVIGDTIVARNRSNGCDVKVRYDKLIIATGAEPVKPNLRGIELPGTFKLRSLEDARMIAEWAKKSRYAVVYGAGFLGLQVADALSKLGLNVTVVEPMDYVLYPMIDPDVSLKVRGWLEEQGVKVVTGFREGEIVGTSKVEKISGAGLEEKCDIVILATKVKPDVAFALNVGVELGPTGAIKVDERMETSIEGVFAAGDCVEVKELITGNPVNAQVATTAIREARVAALNSLGGDEQYHGTTLMGLSQVFGLEIGIVGLSSLMCRRLGLNISPVFLELNARAKYYPEKALIKLLADKESGRIVGAQLIGHASSMRASLLSLAISKGLTVNDMAKLEVAYYPSITADWDPLVEASRSLADDIKDKTL
ncbi:MAG: FAD-dependent oxidoreductase [Thermoproteota archaeon]